MTFSPVFHATKPVNVERQNLICRKKERAHCIVQFITMSFVQLTYADRFHYTLSL